MSKEMFEWKSTNRVRRVNYQKEKKRHDVRGYQVTKMLPSRVVESRVQEEGWC